MAATPDAPPEQCFNMVKLSNFYLGNVVHGFLWDPLELKLFDFCFMQENIINLWIKVGFMPHHTGNVALDPKVHHELVKTVTIPSSG